MILCQAYFIRCSASELNVLAKSAKCIMGTEHNNINANDRYKGYTSFHDNAS